MIVIIIYDWLYRPVICYCFPEYRGVNAGLGVNADKTEYISLNQKNNSCIKSLKGKIIKQVNEFSILEAMSHLLIITSM